MSTRRRVLASVGTVLAGGLAGCSAIPGVGSDDGFAMEEFSPYEAWIPDCSSGPVNFFATNPADYVDIDQLEDEETGIFGTPTGKIAHLIDLSIGEPLEGFDHEALVAIGDYDVAGARDGFEADQDVTTESAGEYGEYELFGVENADEHDGYTFVGATQDVVVAASDEEIFEALADTEAGNRDALVAEYDAFEKAVGTIDTQDWQQFRVRFPEETGHSRLVRGMGYDFGSDTSTFTEVSVYTSADAAETEESAVLDHWQNKEDGTSDVSATVDGRVLTVTGEQETVEWE